MELRRLILISSLSAFLLLVNGVGVSEGLKCYECGTFLSGTSVSPCLNFTGGHLKICPYAFCSKYVGLSSTVIVYSCEPNCIEKQHGSFDSYCCTDDGCNISSVVSSPQSLLILTATILSSSYLVLLMRSYAFISH